jgi:stage II sporulation protein D
MSVYDAVCQIVAYEAGTGQPDEHVKAQAVASYTYLMNGGGNISAGLSTAKLDSRTQRLVAEVIGYAVLDDKSNKVILATYFSESCGETANAEWVWGYANRNLLSVSSPVDGKNSKTYTISSDDFAAKVEEKAGITLTGSPSNWIKIASYWGDTDYVNQVKLGGTNYSARKLRETVLGTSKLRSTAFDVKYDSASDNFVFTMRGYGHGVGMSAIGSIAYAKQGYEWDEILLKYYSNCYIGFKEP